MEVIKGGRGERNSGSGLDLGGGGCPNNRRMLHEVTSRLAKRVNARRGEARWRCDTKGEGDEATAEPVPVAQSAVADNITYDRIYAQYQSWQVNIMFMCFSFLVS